MNGGSVFHQQCNTECFKDLSCARWTTLPGHGQTLPTPQLPPAEAHASCIVLTDPMSGQPTVLKCSLCACMPFSKLCRLSFALGVVIVGCRSEAALVGVGQLLPAAAAQLAGRLAESDVPLAWICLVQ
eukprot:1767173-Amphidinium_carterae.1